MSKPAPTPSTAASRPLWRRVMLLGSLVVLMAAVAASGYWLAGRRIYTDGRDLRMPAADANLREVLWTKPVTLGPDFNTEAQEYEPSVSPDGQEAYFVRGKPTESQGNGGGNGADIYVSYRRNNAWTEPVPLADVNTNYDDLGPRLTADGTHLLFYSDRPGGVGGYDLWAAPRSDAGFGPAFNLGPSVNSEFNEFSPAPTPDGKRLFFATNRKAGFEQQREAWKSTIRQTGLGDYDLFVSDGLPGGNVPVPVTPPAASATRPSVVATTAPAELDGAALLDLIAPRKPAAASQPATAPPASRLAFAPAAEVPGVNTMYHEGSSCLAPNGDFLYFASNRPGGVGKFDLYRVRIHAGAYGEVENLGREVNTADNETDPQLAMGGFLMYFSSDRARSAGESVSQSYDLLTSESHEVYPDRQSRPMPKLGLSAWLLLAALLALVPLLFMLRGWNDGRLNLFQKCLLVSVLIHVLMTILFSAAKVSHQIVVYVKEQERAEQLTVTLADTGGGAGAAYDVSQQARQQLTDTAADVPEPPALAQQAQPATELPKANEVARLNVPLARPDAGAMQVQVAPPKATAAPQPDAPAPSVALTPPQMQPVAPRLDLQPPRKVDAPEQVAQASPADAPSARAVQAPLSAAAPQGVKVEIAPAEVRVGTSMAKPVDVAVPSVNVPDVGAAGPSVTAPAAVSREVVVEGPKVESAKVAGAAPAAPGAAEADAGMSRQATGNIVGEAATVQTNVPQADRTVGTSLASAAPLGRQVPQDAIETDVKPMVERGGPETIAVRPPTTQPLRKVEQTGPTIAGAEMPAPQDRTAPIGAADAARAAGLPQTAAAPVNAAEAAGGPIATPLLQPTTRPAGVASLDAAGGGVRPSATTQPSPTAPGAVALTANVGAKNSRVAAEGAVLPTAAESTMVPQRQDVGSAANAGAAQSVKASAPAVGPADAGAASLATAANPAERRPVAAAVAGPSASVIRDANAPAKVDVPAAMASAGAQKVAAADAAAASAEAPAAAVVTRAVVAQDAAGPGAIRIDPAAAVATAPNGAIGSASSLATGSAVDRRTVAVTVQGAEPAVKSDGAVAAAGPTIGVAPAMAAAAGEKLNVADAGVSTAEAPTSVAARAPVAAEAGVPGAIRVDPSAAVAAAQGGSDASLASGAAAAAPRTMDLAAGVAAAQPGKPIDGAPFSLPGAAKPIPRVVGGAAPETRAEAPAAVASRAEVKAEPAGPEKIEVASAPTYASVVPGAAAFTPDAAIGPKPRAADASSSALDFKVRVAAPKLAAPPAMFQRSAEQRKPILEKMGGTKESEDAVERALAYLARNQEGDGHWTRVQGDRGKRRNNRNETSDHDPALTGLCVLAFLAADHTPTDPGPYQEVVARGIEYLINTQRPDGDLRGKRPGGGADSGNMYDHGIAVFALAEAALMTGDKRIAEAAFRGCDYIVKAQHKRTGGWRYVPGESGDTSVFGWQVMALHSAEQVGYSIPADCRKGMDKYIDIASSGKHKSLGGYQPGGSGTQSMSAELLFCRIMLDHEITPQQEQEVSKFLTRDMPDRGNADFYCWYYGSLSLIQLQNDAWRTWNERTRETLVSMQTRGGENDGMFDGNIQWRGQGGRIYTTALATLTLEVYYRYLPLRAEAQR